MNEQHPLPGLPVESRTPIDPEHEHERRIFAEVLEKEDVPFADLYAELYGQGWYWRKAAVAAWLAMPKSERWPATQGELADLIGCGQRVVSEIKRRPEVSATVMRITTAALFAHKASVDDALVRSASNADYKHNQDRKTYYQMIGALREEHTLTLQSSEEAAMRDMSDEELLALAGATTDGGELTDTAVGSAGSDDEVGDV